MEIIKRKISLDDYTSRKDANWGQLTATTFNINVFITQDGDDMGIGTEMPFIAKGDNTTLPNNTSKLVDYDKLVLKLVSSGYTFSFMGGATTNVLESGAYPNTRYPNKVLSQYFKDGGPITGLTEDRLDNVTSYIKTNKYKPGFDISKSSDIDYKGIPYNNGTRVLKNVSLNPITYIVDGDTSVNPSDPNPIIKRGVHYTTFNDTVRTVSGTEFGTYAIPYTEMRYSSEGFNKTNIHLSATTKEEYLYGITSEPTVFSDLFIERGRATVVQSHMQLGEIKNMSDLINYGNGFYKIQR